MKHLILFFLLPLVVFSCKKEACSTKQDFLTSFDNYLNDQEKLTLQDNIIFNEEFKNLVNNCYKKFKEELTLEERQEFWKKSFKSILDNYEGDLDLNIGEEQSDPFNQYVLDEVSAVIKDSGVGFLVELQNFFKDDIGRVMEIFSSEINNLTQEFMKIFQSGQSQ